MCGGDDHLAWKHLVFLEACRGLYTVGGYDYFCQGSFNLPILFYRATSTLQASLDPIKISFLHMGAFVDLQSYLGHNWVQLSSSQYFFGVIKVRYHIEYIWALFLRTYQLIPIESPLYCTLSSVPIFVGGFIVTNLNSLLWIRVRGRLTRVSDQRDMDSQIVIVDQFAAAMTSIQEALASLGQMIDGQQTQQVPVQESAQFDTIVPPPLHSVSQYHNLYFSLCIVRLSLSHLLSHCLSRPQRTHIHVWIDLSIG